jgi:hypothetical protein
VPSINYLNGNIQYVNLFTSNEPIDIKRYIIIQIVCLLTFILLNKIIGNIDFNLISWFLKFKNRLYKFSLFLLSILFFYLLYEAYDQFIIKPRIVRDNEIARIAKNKRDSLENLKLEEQRREEEAFRNFQISYVCKEENAKRLLIKWVNFYHKDSKIISKIDMYKVDDCTFKASFRITWIESQGYTNQGVVCRLDLNPETNSLNVFTEKGYFY